MAIDVSTLAIRVTSDGIKDATTSLEKLTTAAKEAEKHSVVLTETTKKSSSATEGSTTRIEALIKKMQTQVDLLGASNEKMALYKASSLSADAAQISLAGSLGRQVDSFRAQASAVKAAELAQKQLTAAQEAGNRLNLSGQRQQEISAINSQASAMSKLQAEANRMNASWERGKALNIVGERQKEVVATKAAEAALLKYAAAQEFANKMNVSFDRKSSEQILRAEASAMSKLHSEALKMNSEWEKGKALNASGFRQQQISDTLSLGKAQQVATKTTQDHNVAMKEAHALARGLSGSLGALWVTYGNLAGMAVGVALGASLKGVVSVGKDVEGALERIRVLGESTTKEIAAMRDTVVSLGRGINGPRDVAEALSVLSLAGLNATESMKGVGAALDLAAVGGVSVEKAASTLVQVSTSLGYTADGFSRVGDVIAKTAAVSMSSVESISGAFKSAASVGELYGATLTDIGVGLAALSNLGIQGTAAGTAMKNFYGDLVKGSDKVENAFKSMKMSISDLKDADGFFLPLIEVIKKLDSGMASLTGPAQKDALRDLFGERGVKEGTALIKMLHTVSNEVDEFGNRYANKLEEIADRVNKSYAFSALGAIAMAQTTENQLKSVSNTLQTVFLKAFQEVSPQIGEVSRALKAAFNSPEFSNGIKTIAVAVADLTKFLVEHIGIIGELIKFYLAFKAVEIASTIIKIALAFDVASIAARGFVASLGPIGLAIAGLTTLWILYKTSKDDATNDKSSVNSLTAQVEAMREADEKLRKTLEMKKSGMSEIAFMQLEQQKKDKAAIAKGIEDSAASVVAMQKEVAAKMSVLTANEKLQLSMKSVNERANVSSTVEAAIESQKRLNEAELIHNKNLSESDKLTKSMMAASKELSKIQDEEAKAGRGKPSGTGELLEKEGKPTRISGIQAEIMELKKLQASYTEKASAQQAFADQEVKQIAYVQEAKVLAELQEGKYANAKEAHLRAALLQAAVEADRAKFSAERTTALAEAHAKMSRHLEIETSGLAEARSGHTKLTDVYEAQATAIKKSWGMSDKEAESLLATAKAAGEAQAAKERLMSFNKGTATITTDAQSLLEGAAALVEYGKAGKQSAVELAQLKITQAGLNAETDQGAISERIGATALKDIGEAAKGFAKTNNDLAEEIKKAQLDSATMLEDTEVRKVMAKSDSAEKQIKFDMAIMESAKAAAILNNTYTAEMEAAYASASQAAQNALTNISKFINAQLPDAQAKDMQNMWEKAANGISDSLTKAFGKGGKAAADMVQVMKKSGQDQLVLDAKLANDKLKHPEKLAKLTEKYEAQKLENSLDTYGSMAGAAKGFFNEQSTAYKVLSGIEQAMYAVKFAMQAATIVGNMKVGASGVAASGMQQAADMVLLPLKIALGIANQANGDPYTAFARIAAMAGILAGVAAIAGVSVGGGGGSSGSSSESRQKTQGTGSVLGDEDAKSESLTKAMEILEHNSTMLLPLTNSMLSALHNIRDNIKGMASAIAQTTGLRGGPRDTEGLGLSESPGFLGMFKSSTTLTDQGIQFGKKIVETMKTEIPRHEGESNTTEAYTISREITKYIGQSIAEIRLEGVSGTKYSETQTKNSGIFGLFSSSSSATIFKDLDENIKKQMTRTVLSIADGVQAAGLALGMAGPELAAKIDAFNVELGMISLKGLKGQELQDELNAVFSRFADDLATNVIPGLEQFSQVGEGYFETVVRVASGIEKAKFELGQLGIVAIAYTDIVRKQGDVTLEMIRQSVVLHESSSGATTGIGQIINSFNGTADEAVELYLKLIDVRKEMRIFGGVAADVTLAMIKGAGGLEKLSDGLKFFNENFRTKTEQTTAAGVSLGESMNKLGIAMPKNREEFNKMVDMAYRGSTIANQNKEAYQTLYGGMMANSQAAHEFYSALEELETKFVSNIGLLRGQQPGDTTLGGLSQAWNQIKSLELPIGSVSQLLTMTVDDFQNYSVEGQTAITNLLTSFNSALEEMGISFSQISDVIRDGIMGQMTNADVGKKLGEMLVNSVTKALATRFADQMTATIMKNLVTPLMEEVFKTTATAGSIAKILSGANIAAMISDLKTYVQNMKTLFNNPEFKALMESIGKMFEGFDFGATGVSSGNGAPGTPTESGDGGKAYRDALKAITDDIRKFGEALANLGETTYEAAIRQIKDAARVKAEQLAGMDNSGAVAELQAQAKFRAQKELDDFIKLAVEAEAKLNPGQMVHINALPGYTEALEKYKAAMEAAGQITINNTELLDKWVQSQIDLLNAQNKIKAAAITDDLEKQIGRTGMSQLEIQIADVNEKAQAYLKSLNDLGQTTEANTTAVEEWRQSMLGIIAAKGAIGTMKNLLVEIDKLASLRDTIGNAIQTIRQDSKDYDLSTYLKDNINKFKSKINAGDTDDKIANAGKLQESIVAEYNFQKGLLEKKADAERKVYEDSLTAQNKAIDLANKLSDAYREIGKYAEGMLLGAQSPLGLFSRKTEAEKQYRDLLARTNMGDVDAAGKLTASNSTFLDAKKATSVTSIEFTREFMRSYNELSKIGAKAQATIEDVTAEGFKMSAELQTEFNTLQESAIDELIRLQDQIDIWSSELQNQFQNQIEVLTNLGLSSAQIAANTQGLDSRIATALAAILGGQPAAPQDFGVNTELNKWLASQTGYTEDFGGGKFMEFLSRNPVFDFEELMTRAPSFAVGTNLVPEDMLASIHAGERIIPAADNKLLMARLASPQANSEALVAEIRALRTELAAANERIAKASEETKKNTKELADMERTTTQGGTTQRVTVIT